MRLGAPSVEVELRPMICTTGFLGAGVVRNIVEMHPTVGAAMRAVRGVEMSANVWAGGARRG